jgi:hypothetical protein
LKKIWPNQIQGAIPDTAALNCFIGQPRWESDMVASNSTEFELAWKNYYRRIESVRERIYALDWMQRPGVRDAVHYYTLQVQAAAFNMVIGPRRDYPSLSLHTTYEPILYSLSNHSADFNLRFGFVDGSKSYRIWGKRNGSLFIDIQIINKIYGSDRARNLGNYDVDAIGVDHDGNFEFIVSATPQSGNWIKLDPESPDNIVLLREAFDDWEQPRAEINIQRIDDGQPGRMSLSEAELIRRLSLAENYIDFYMWTWAAELTTRMLAQAGSNRFHFGIFKTNQGAGNNPMAQYPGAVYELGDDEALIVEVRIPNARYWNVQLSDAMWQVIDFTYHQSSLNSHQARVDADGYVRFIISRDDPGVVNWLDPVDNPFGILFFRVYGADSEVIPEITFKGSIMDALSRLPRDTARISLEQRTLMMARRTAAARARFAD